MPLPSARPHVAISAHCDSEYEGAALAAGRRACVGEPVDLELHSELLDGYARGV